MGIFMYTHPLYSQFESNGWQWMKQYCGIEPFNGGTNNRIIDVAFDSVGDIYILGKFSQGAELDGEDLCGEISNSDSPIMLFAKISKQTGRIIWKKRIASSGASIGNPTFILKNNKLTLFAPYILFRYNNGYLPYFVYYLDTFYYTQNSEYTYPFNQYNSFSALINFDLDGNKLDEHFMQVVNRDSTYVLTHAYFGGSLVHIDNEGNRYFTSIFTVADTDTTKPFILMVDDTNRYYFKLRDRSDDRNGVGSETILLKFSPDMELLWYKPLISHFEGIHPMPGKLRNQVYMESIPMQEYSEDSCFYLKCHLNCPPQSIVGWDTCQTFPAKTYFDSTHYITMDNYLEFTPRIPFILKIDTAGNVVWVDKTRYITNIRSTGVDAPFSTISMDDSIIYAGSMCILDSNEYNVYLDEDHQYQIPQSVDSTDLYCLVYMRFIKKISRRTGEYLGYSVLYPRCNSCETVYDDHFSANDTLYAFANFMFENYGKANHTELIAWDKEGNYLGTIDTMPYIGSFYTHTQKDGSVFAYVDFEVINNSHPATICLNDTLCINICRSNENVVFGMLFDSMFIDRSQYRDSVGDSTVSAYEVLSTDADISVYPNPTASYVSISLTEADGYLRSEIWNSNGALLRIENKTKFSLQDLPAGQYFIRIYTHSKVYTQKVIKK